MGQRIVGQKQDWVGDLFVLLVILVVGGALAALAFWLLWLETK